MIFQIYWLGIDEIQFRVIPPPPFFAETRILKYVKRPETCHWYYLQDFLFLCTYFMESVSLYFLQKVHNNDKILSQTWMYLWIPCLSATSTMFFKFFFLIFGYEVADCLFFLSRTSNFPAARSWKGARAAKWTRAKEKEEEEEKGKATWGEQLPAGVQALRIVQGERDSE